ncbi:response regulator transcription factor [Nocardioides kongjuensis]
MPRASAAERRGLVDRADRLLADGEAVLAAIRERSGPWGPEGRMWTDRLVAEHHRVQWLAGGEEARRDELLAAWEAALDSTVKVGNVPELLRVRAAYAQILRLLGDTARARDEADQARALADRLGAPLLVADLAAEPGAARGAATTSHSGGAALTARELEILGLVAEGRSNGEIGKQLFISTKTVSVHVSNILGKLGAAGRTEAAAIARRDGLLP